MAELGELVEQKQRIVARPAGNAHQRFDSEGYAGPGDAAVGGQLVGWQDDVKTRGAAFEALQIDLCGRQRPHDARVVQKRRVALGGEEHAHESAANLQKSKAAWEYLRHDRQLQNTAQNKPDAHNVEVDKAEKSLTRIEKAIERAEPQHRHDRLAQVKEMQRERSLERELERGFGLGR